VFTLLFAQEKSLYMKANVQITNAAEDKTLSSSSEEDERRKGFRLSLPMF